MKYKLGAVIFDDQHGIMQTDDDLKVFRGLVDDSLHLPVDIWATKEDLIAMGALPLHDCTCGKCGKPKKIEPLKMRDDFINNLPGTISPSRFEITLKINELIEAVNSLKGE